MSRRNPRHRNNVVMVNNEEWNQRFFKACQIAKEPRFMDQSVKIIGWKAFRRGGLVAANPEADIVITGLAMTGNKPPSFSDYIAEINRAENVGLNDDGELQMNLVIEITYYHRGKKGETS